MLKKRFTKAAVALGCAAVFTLAALLGLFYSPDQMLADALYQKPKALDGNIFVIGIDDRAIDDIGPYQTWGRDVMAMAIEALNADPENRPAAIGIDVLYTGETDPELDAWLAEAAGAYGNVVVACAANFGTELVTEDTGSFYLEDYAVLSFEEPYEALRAVTTQGHINAMYDADGVLRHSILRIDLPDGRSVPSFNYAIYQKYAEARFLRPARRLLRRHFRLRPAGGRIPRRARGGRRSAHRPLRRRALGLCDHRHRPRFPHVRRRVPGERHKPAH